MKCQVNMKLQTADQNFAPPVTGFGLTLGSQLGADVASILTPTDLQNSDLKEQNQSSSALENTFRIYRHDYGHGPYPLRTGEYELRFPDNENLDNWLVQQNFNQLQAHSLKSGNTIL